MTQSDAKNSPYILLCHGLNFNPEKMNDLESEYQKLGFRTKNLILPGHANDQKGIWKNIELKTWRGYIYEQYNLVLKQSKKEKFDIYICAYSLGALLFQDLFLHYPNIIKPKKLVYFAPAIPIKNHKIFINLLMPFSGKIIIPSVNLKDYRKWNGTSLNAYRALIELEKSVLVSHEKHWNHNIPTLIFIDPRDELIDFKKLKKQISKNIQIQLVHKEVNFFSKTANHHLIIDKKTLDEKLWKATIDRIKTFTS